jgi:hypothetical protein
VGDVASRAGLDPTQMMLWIMGTTLVAAVACVLSWGSFEYDAGLASTAPPSQAIEMAEMGHTVEMLEMVETVGLVEPGRPDS